MKKADFFAKCFASEERSQHPLKLKVVGPYVMLCGKWTNTSGLVEWSAGVFAAPTLFRKTYPIPYEKRQNIAFIKREQYQRWLQEWSGFTPDPR